MARVIETTVYTFEELSPKAKDRARDRWRTAEGSDFDSDYVIEDAVEIAKILGIEFDDRAVKLMNGGVRYEPAVFFSGFCSQGDGACFEGFYRYARGAAKKIREYAPQDTALHAIADGLQRLQQGQFYALEARMRHRGRYQHSGCMTVEVEDTRTAYRDIPRAIEDDITGRMRDFADWIYQRLQNAYDWTMSDENVDEMLTVNGYEFEETGEIV